jgi:hypothetical protein
MPRWNIVAKFTTEGGAKASLEIDRIGGNARKSASGVDQLKNAVKALAASYVAVRAVDFIKASIGEWMEYDKALRQVRAGLVSTGGAAGMNEVELRKLADQIARTTNYTDDQALSAEALLLTFTRINRDAFPQAISLSADLATKMKMDLQSAVLMVGKALNDPIAGLTAMTRAGVQFTDMQKEEIKALVKSGELLKAQGIIMAELSTQVGGSAAADRDAFTSIRKAVEDAQQAFGEGLGPELTKTIAQLETLEGQEEVLALLRDLGQQAGVAAGFFAKLAAAVARVPIAQAIQLMGYFRSVKEDIALSLSGIGLEEDARNQLAFMQAAARAQQGMAQTAEQASAAAARKAKEEAAAAVSMERQKKAQQEAAAAAERTRKAVAAARADVERQTQALELLSSGRARQDIEDLVAAATQLGAVNLQDPMVRQLAEVMAKVRELRAEFEATTRAFSKIDPKLAPGYIPQRDTFGDKQTTVNEAAKAAAAELRRETEKLADSMSKARDRFGEFTEELRGWADVVDQIGQMTGNQSVQQAGAVLGGFGNAASASQQAQQQGSALAYANAVTAWLALFITIAEMFTKQNGKLILTLSDLGNTAGAVDERVKRAGEGTLQLVQGYVATVKFALNSIGGVMQELGNSQVVVKGDQAWVRLFEGGIVKFGNDIRGAMEFATIQAIKAGRFLGLSENTRAAIENSVALSLEGFLADINLAKEIDVLGEAAPEVARGIQSMVQQFVVASERAAELGLDISNLVTGLTRDLNSVRNQILGVEEDPKERARRQVETFNSQVALVRAEMELRVAELHSRKAELSAKAELVRAEAGIARGEITIRQALLAGERAIIQEYAGLLAALAAIDTAIAAAIGAIGAIPALITDEELQAILDNVGKPGKGSGGSRGQVRDFIADRRFGLSLDGMTEYERQVAELNRTFDEQAKQVGKNKELLAQLNALRAEELALLAQQAARDTVGKFREFLGLVTPFDQVRDTAADLIKEIEGSPFGDARKARMIGRVLEEVERQIERMSQQMAGGLLSEMLQSLEQYGASEALMAEVRRNIAIIEHTLKMEHYRAEIAILKAQADLAPEVMKALEDAFAFLLTIDPTTGVGGGGAGWGQGPPPQGGTTVGQTRQYNGRLWRWDGTRWVDAGGVGGEGGAGGASGPSASDRARELLDRYLSDGMSSLARELAKIEEDFATIRAGLGDTAEVQMEYAKAIRRAIDEYLEPVRAFRSGMDFAGTSTLTGEQQFYASRDEFREVASRILAGDLGQRDKLLEFAELYRTTGKGFTAGSAFRFIDSEIKGVFDQLIAQVPGFSATASPLGAVSNPMTMQSPELQGAIEIGNSMLLSEARLQTVELKAARLRLDSIAATLSNPLNVRDVA